MNILPSNQIQARGDEQDQHQNLKTSHNCMRENIAELQDSAQERSIQEASFRLSSLTKPEAKRRKTDTTEAHGSRIIRSTGRKDRHSKVCTAKGTRDRRLRLSPKTAILFYDVQDRLGYDRPSKAIDWLMKEAKAEIDALYEPPNVAQIHGSKNDQQILKNEGGIVQNLEHLNNEGAAPFSSTEFQGYLNGDFNSTMSRLGGREDCQNQFLATPLEIPDTDFEVARLQRIFSWNYGNGREAGEDYSAVSSLPLRFPSAADIDGGHMFLEREPLQSSYDIATNYSPQFPGVSFSNDELPNF